YSGGAHNSGVIFSFNPSNSAYTRIKDFDWSIGSNPNGNLMQASNGKLYGMTSTGGSGNEGVIFSLDPSNSAFTKLKDFDGLTSSYPLGSLVQATNGKLYGTTTFTTSTFGNGVLFS